MSTATLGKMILIADMSGDRPAIITKVFTNTSAEAITASQRDTKFHAYWAPKA